MTRQYAARTDVSTGQSRDEIERELSHLGARRQAIYRDDEEGTAVVLFERVGATSGARRYRITLPLPVYDWKVYGYTPARRIERSESQARTAWEQDCRARWRALAEYIKMLRVSIEAGIITIEQALLYATVIPETGETVGEWSETALVDVYDGRPLPPLLPGIGETSR